MGDREKTEWGVGTETKDGTSILWAVIFGFSGKPGLPVVHLKKASWLVDQEWEITAGDELTSADSRLHSHAWIQWRKSPAALCVNALQITFKNRKIIFNLKVEYKDIL